VSGDVSVRLGLDDAAMIVAGLKCRAAQLLLRAGQGDANSGQATLRAWAARHLELASRIEDLARAARPLTPP
jgi:hypothetical protein